MKNLIVNSNVLFFILLIACASCSKDTNSVNNNGEVSNNGEHLTIDGIKTLFPIENYKSNSKVKFRNSSGDTRELKIFIDEGSIDKKSDKISYTTDFVRCYLIEEENPNYYLEANLQANYVEETMNNVEGMSVAIKSEVGTRFSIIFISLDPFGLFNKVESKDLLDKTFEDVYFNSKIPGQEGFTEVYFNAEFGFIGFKDENDDLFVYESIE